MIATKSPHLPVSQTCDYQAQLDAELHMAEANSPRPLSKLSILKMKAEVKLLRINRTLLNLSQTNQIKSDAIAEKIVHIKDKLATSKGVLVQKASEQSDAVGNGKLPYQTKDTVAAHQQAQPYMADHAEVLYVKSGVNLAPAFSPSPWGDGDASQYSAPTIMPMPFSPAITAHSQIFGGPSHQEIPPTFGMPSASFYPAYPAPFVAPYFVPNTVVAAPVTFAYQEAPHLQQVPVIAHQTVMQMPAQATITTVTSNASVANQAPHKAGDINRDWMNEMSFEIGKLLQETKGFGWNDDMRLEALRYMLGARHWEKPLNQAEKNIVKAWASKVENLRGNKVYGAWNREPNEQKKFFNNSLRGGLSNQMPEKFRDAYRSIWTRYEFSKAPQATVSYSEAIQNSLDLIRQHRKRFVSTH